uniref:Uncharacterized protein n=1 Tax=Meloidogyne enterolobii TaxID=390850 RepID=A0A6V7U3J7_MELEN|nr:unnamed protein product [Meloidogyne enterolobii]
MLQRRPNAKSSRKKDYQEKGQKLDFTYSYRTSIQRIRRFNFTMLQRRPDGISSRRKDYRNEEHTYFTFNYRTSLRRIRKINRRK